jgi:hypothetical protein
MAGGNSPPLLLQLRLLRPQDGDVGAAGVRLFPNSTFVRH